MKAELQFDTSELVKEIAQEVIKAIKPLLTGKAQDDTIFTVKTLAKYLEVSDQWVYERVHLKEIPHIKMGKFPRFKKSDIDQWLGSINIPSINLLPRRLKVIK